MNQFCSFSIPNSSSIFGQTERLRILLGLGIYVHDGVLEMTKPIYPSSFFDGGYTNFECGLQLIIRVIEVLLYLKIFKNIFIPEDIEHVNCDITFFFAFESIFANTKIPLIRPIPILQTDERSKFDSES